MEISSIAKTIFKMVFLFAASIALFWVTIFVASATGVVADYVDTITVRQVVFFGVFLFVFYRVDKSNLPGILKSVFIVPLFMAADFIIVGLARVLRVPLSSDPAWIILYVVTLVVIWTAIYLRKGMWEYYFTVVCIFGYLTYSMLFH